MKTCKINISANGLAVLTRRYLLKDKLGHVIETPTQLFVRVAQFIAKTDRNYGADDNQVEKTAQEFFDIMANLEFLPNSPTLMNAGRPLGQLSACFVLPVGDSMEEIFDSVKHAALIHKSGGGTGFSFSRLRPRNSIVASTSGVASGPVSFMKAFNATTETVRQGGTRRGANMAILRVDHPDIMEFIACKDNTNEMTNFNISVGITDDFMEALKSDSEYPLFNPHTGRTHQIDNHEVTLRARSVFDSIVEHAWQTGEPGVVFLDRMNQHNPTYPDETIEATNPCGEQPLPPYDSCNLGSINLSQFVLDPLPEDFTLSDPSAGINWEHLASVVQVAVHFLDNVIDQNQYPIEQIEKQTLKNRRIGLGIMGWADLLAKMGLPYNSPEAQELGGQVMAYISTQARNHSSELAKTRGEFPNWANSVFGRDKIAMRNATVTTIAPTGTISIIAGCSSGIEPYYAIAYERNVLDGTRLTELNPLFKKIARKEEFYSDELVATVATKRSLTDVEGIPDSVKAVFLTAADISHEDHIRMQAQFQKHCDSSVSKTINFPESAPREDVAHAFTLAYELGCKGVTVYRDNSRPHQVLSTGTATSKAHDKLIRVEKRPNILQGMTEKIRTGYGNLYVTVNVRDGLPFEVFAHIGKSGYTTMADTEAICRLISLALRSHVPVEVIIRQLRGIGGSSQTFSGGSKIFSIPDAIAQILDRHFGSGKSTDSRNINSDDICPECSGAMIFSSGCFSCPSCGYSNC
ncbi:MAG: ribonucleotide-diphosphate reductase subunit alpha [Candidatus Zixiibacteriota bacterium]|nr:MAG: ribonucleotide-diphosphate reductase subunit alpha [candidate division Zixibacteria bacterium]